jgi:hypothetical protein
MTPSAMSRPTAAQLSNSSDGLGKPVAGRAVAIGLPALSYAAAANPVPSLVAGGRNFDMEAQGRVSGVWPTDGHEGFRLGRWNHSDFKNVSLPYVARMYQAMIDKGNLKNSP